MNGGEKSDPVIVATKPPNEAGRPGTEAVERRAGPWRKQGAGTKGNAEQQSTYRTQSRRRVTQALNRVRQAARQRKQERFTALLHHVRSPPPCQCRHARAGVLRAQARGRPRRGRCDM